jgi:predicted metal-dependent phosphoesterase TrpH
MNFDFDGIEAIYPSNSTNDTAGFIKIATDYNKIITAGSDFHTGNANDTKHGTLASVSLDENRINIFLKKLEE